MPITVVCHSGYRGEEIPRRLHMGQRPIEVTRVLGCSLEPDYRCFKVLGDDGVTYVLRHDAAGTGAWDLAPRRWTDCP